MAKNGSDTVPVQTRVTPELAARLDEIAGELHLTRGHVATLILAAGVQRERDLLKTFRALIAQQTGGQP
ncbi:hypothetical protein [Haloechinothrix salitolerans]|uniref:Ribbon-helix-helix protein, copG family n=1 Tax=Haloechinothrix salitolerans TaxID=926830 RepID=A0ABW2CA49_9PSEU